MTNFNIKPMHDPLLGIHEVMRLTSLSRSAIHRSIKIGNFPQSVAIIPGGSRVAWRESEILRWVAAPLEWGMERYF